MKCYLAVLILFIACCATSCGFLIHCPKDCLKISIDGKPNCRCKPPVCGLNRPGTCPKGLSCQAVATGCEDPPPNQPCDPILTYRCQPIETCPDTPCNIRCAYGLEIDSKNCTVCRCLPNPCETVDCVPPRNCYPTLIGGHPPYEGKCECPLIKCHPCHGGYEYENGCQTCECSDICKKVKCPSGQLCKPLSHGKHVCLPKYPVCPLVKCLPCKSGFVFDKNGCQTCECQDPCEREPCTIIPPNCPRSCAAILCIQGTACCRDKEGCYGCRSPHECSFEPAPISPPFCLRSCATIRCGGDTSCCADARGCYGCRSWEKCLQQPWG